MLAMQYKSFVWPNNPETYTLTMERRTAVQKFPLGGFAVQDLGETCMVLRGEGVFFGKNAMRDFERLEQVFRQDGAGVLLHPAWRGGAALFTQLELTQEPREDYAAYRFAFCQSAAEEKPQALAGEIYVTQRRERGGRMYYRVQSGETAWHICVKKQLTMQELLALNPELSRPDRLEEGQRVRVQ